VSQKKQCIRVVTCLFIGLLPGLSLSAFADAPAGKPNIVFFLVDDMGWMDTTVNGSQYYETPNMER